MAEQKSSSALTAPRRGAAAVLGKVPGAGMVKRAAEDTLDKVGAVSPRSRRMAVYAGAGLLGVAGVVEWPVALTGAAVAWLTQQRPDLPADSEKGAGATGSTEGTGLAAGDREADEPPGPVAVGERADEERAAMRRAGRAEPEIPHGLGSAALTSAPRGGAGRPASPTATEAEGQGGEARSAEGASRTRGSRDSEAADTAGTEASGEAGDTTPPGTAGTAGRHGTAAPHSGRAARHHGDTGRLGPTARPGRTTL
ncbi:hypothetical protein A6P39_45315 [Streptomyces sp. FXJ1.172]|uniref:hypothetical protein n=1 Tax=Streptomyces sp. FXJ1.172 TaxID=710705 RepID=UPI000A5ECCA2